MEDVLVTHPMRPLTFSSVHDFQTADHWVRQRRGIAKLSGVSGHTLSNLETGEGNVTLDTLHKVAVACHMDGHAP